MIIYVIIDFLLADLSCLRSSNNNNQQVDLPFALFLISFSSTCSFASKSSSYLSLSLFQIAFLSIINLSNKATLSN